MFVNNNKRPQALFLSFRARRNVYYCTCIYTNIAHAHTEGVPDRYLRSWSSCSLTCELEQQRAAVRCCKFILPKPKSSWGVVLDWSGTSTGDWASTKSVQIQDRLTSRAGCITVQFDRETSLSYNRLYIFLSSCILRWFALRREGPGAESEGKDCKAFDTDWALTEMEGGGGSSGRGGWGDRGCLASISSKTD